MAKENTGLGYDRIVGALSNLGHQISGPSEEHPAPSRDRSGPEAEPDHHVEGFLSTHMNVLTGCDFFTVEVLTWRGLVTQRGVVSVNLQQLSASLFGRSFHGGRCQRRERLVLS